MKLLHTLQRGKDRLGKESFRRIARFVDSQRTEEDSFRDRSGKADLYYTLFGWILSYVLGIGPDRKKMAAYLAQQDADSPDLISYAAYMRCRMIELLMNKRRAGLVIHSLFSTKIKALHEFSSLPHDDPKAPYTQFIRLSLLEDTGNRYRNRRWAAGVVSRFKTGGGSPSIRDSETDDDAFVNKKDITESLECYRAKGGGFGNVRNATAATTNATVAALAVKGQLGGYAENEDVRYLRDLQEPSGGFGAVEGAPMPDLLSTATALFMLNCYGVRPKYAAGDFIEAHWLDSGGFSATLLEEMSDVEYTFYGILSLGAI
jgi:hypothetical protein